MTATPSPTPLPGWNPEHGLSMLHTARCHALRAEVDRRAAATARAFKQSRTAGQRALDHEAEVRRPLIACHVGLDAECFYPGAIVGALVAAGFGAS